MNGRAAAKAVGVYLAILVPVGAWISGIVWCITTSAEESVAVPIAGAPIWLAAAVAVFYLIVFAPTRALYDHFNRKGGK